MVRNAILTLIIAVLTGVVGCSAREGVPAFDAERAFTLLERQVAFGPRVPGTSSHDAAQEWLFTEIRRATPLVTEQPFRGVFGGREVDMSNIMASFYPDMTDRVLLCAHWDSRHAADHDPDPARRLDPVPGANDGASGVAVLLEIARIIAEEKPRMGVDIVFFDGEDGGSEGEEATWLLGSRHFAATMPDGYRPRFAVLLDMIGDRDLRLVPDYLSRNSAPDLLKRIHALCGELGIPVSPNEISILDDHAPLIARGIPSVDIIDFDYPAWHTTADLPDRCSSESLGKIGALVLTLLYRE